MKTTKQIEKELEKIEKQRADLYHKENELEREKKKLLCREWAKRDSLEKLEDMYETAEIKNPEDKRKSANAFIDASDYLAVITEHKVSSLFKNEEEYRAVAELGYEEQVSDCFMHLRVESKDNGTINFDEGYICFNHGWINYEDPVQVVMRKGSGITYEQFKTYVDKVEVNTGGNYKVYITKSDSDRIRLGNKNDVKRELKRLKQEAKEA